MSKTLPEIVQQLKDADKKVQLIYAFKLKQEGSEVVSATNQLKLEIIRLVPGDKLPLGIHL